MRRTLTAALFGTVVFSPSWGEQHIADGVLRVPAAVNNAESGPVDPAEGFAISLNGRPLDGGDPQIEDQARLVDEALERANVQVKFDGLDVDPRLDFEVLGDRDSFEPGQTLRVKSIMNYPAFVVRGEFHVVDYGAVGGPRTLGVLDVDPNGTVSIVVPDGENIYLSHRVYDANGRYDETVLKPLNLSRDDTESDGIEDGIDTAERRRIPIVGGSITVYGEDLPANSSVSTMGETIQTDASGSFVLQRIVPPGVYGAGVRTASGLNIVRQARVPDSDWFYVGTADLTFGRRSGDLYGDETYSRGRLSFFVDGRRATGTRITASVDTGEEDLSDIFRRFDERDPQSILRRIDPNDLYPTYGDDSTLEDAAPTSGRFFLRVEREGNYLQWGDTAAEIDGGTYLRNERELYGASGRYASAEQTGFGEPRYTFSGHAALPDQLPQRDVFLATGGSIFFLQRQDIAIGTERITIQLRDATTGRVLSTETLERGADYQINYLQGVVTLNQPLAQSFETDGIVVSTPGGDQDVSLAVQYEYTPLTGDVDTFSFGGRAETWLNDKWRLGVTATKDETVTDAQTALGFDVRYRMSEQSYVALDYAATDGPGLGSSVSGDGGLVFDTEPTALGRGSAIRVETHLDFADLGVRHEGALGGYLERRSEGFSTLDYQVTASTGDEQLWGVYADVEVNERLSWQGVFDSYDNDAGQHERVGEISLEYVLDPVRTLAFGIEHTDKNRGSGDLGSRTDVAARYTRTLNDASEYYYVYAQGTIARDDLERNDRIGVGGSFELSEFWTLEGELSAGSLGGGANILASYDNGDGSTRYVGYDLTPERTLSGVTLNGRDRGRFILGGQQQVSERTSVFSENSYDMFGTHRSLTNTFGVTYDVTPSSSVTASLTSGQVSDTTNGDFDRDAITLGYRSSTEATSGGARLEYRQDDGMIGGTPRNTETLAFTADFQRKFDEERRLKFVLDAVTSDTNGLTTDGDYVDANIGYAFRPIENDRLNFISRYRFLYDTYGQEIDGFDVSGAVQRSHVASLDAIYEINEHFEVGGKIGARLTDSAANASLPLTENNAVLAVANLRWHVVSKWDALFELRALDLQSSDQTETGALAAAYRHFGNNWKVGVGYNFSNFSDDLTDLSLDDKGVFINLIAKF